MQDLPNPLRTAVAMYLEVLVFEQLREDMNGP